MSVIGSNILAGASGQGGGYNLTRSLRFRRSASAFLNRTPASTTSRTTWTWSSWVKRGQLGATQTLFSAGDATGAIFYNRIVFDSNDRLSFYNYPDTTATSSGFGWLTSTAVYRDPSAWYHVVCIWDSANATSSNRMRMFVNGVQVTSFISDGFSPTYPNQNTNSLVNSNSYVHRIGQTESGNSGLLDGYLTEVNFIDGQALTPSSFGETSTTTGVWQPKRYAGTYGTNGFYLPFTDNSALTTSSNVGLGKDFSGNGNYWTTNNISITSGSTYDSMTDVPTLTSATASNFATFNPLLNSTGAFSATPTYSQANLLATGTADTKQYYSESTIYFGSGKFYAEFIPSSVTGNSSYVGCVSEGFANFALYAPTGEYYNGSSWTAYGATYTTNDVIGVAIDANAGTITFYKNGTSQGQKTISTGVNWVFRTSSYNTGASHSWTANFGQRPFAYTPPTGFVALNTFNLPTPTIGATASTQANKYFDATTYTGTGSALTVTNAGGFQPDLVWIKARSSANNNNLTDAVRGVTKILFSNANAAEATFSGGLASFNSNGFSLATGGDTGFSANGSTYVAWQWKANGTGVTNTVGTITSTVSANTTSGFSVVTYSGNGSAGATVGHGLDVAPSMIIVKRRSASEAWGVYHKSLGATKAINLELTVAAYDYSIAWNNTAPTSSVFSLGTWAAVNSSGGTFVAYCFSEVAGYSKFGSYTGNGSADGPFIATGFKPKYVLVKASSTTGGWNVVDGTRSPNNVVDDVLFPNLSDAEGTFNWMDFTSNGFKIRNTLAGSNTNGTTYIYMAFAEVPQKFALGV